MNVVEAQSALLSDYEVLCLLRERDGPAAGGGVDKKADAAAMDLTALATSSTTGSSHLPQNVATVEFETRAHLSTLPCALYTAEVVERFLERMRDFSLTKAEKLMILNMIEEAESRFDGDEMQRLLQTINDVLPRPQNSEEDDAAPVDGEEEVLEGADDMEMSEEAAR